MPSTLPPFAWPVPDDTDPLADGAAAIRALAAGVAATIDSDLDGLMVQTGIVSTGPANAASFSQAVTFPRAFGSGPTVVMVNLASGAGATGGWSGRVISAGASSFTLFGYGPSAATFTTNWTWLAIGPRQT